MYQLPARDAPRARLATNPVRVEVLPGNSARILA